MPQWLRGCPPAPLPAWQVDIIDADNGVQVTQSDFVSIANIRIRVSMRMRWLGVGAQMASLDR